MRTATRLSALIMAVLVAITFAAFQRGGNNPHGKPAKPKTSVSASPSYKEQVQTVAISTSNYVFIEVTRAGTAFPLGPKEAAYQTQEGRGKSRIERLYPFDPKGQGTLTVRAITKFVNGHNDTITCQIITPAGYYLPPPRSMPVTGNTRGVTCTWTYPSNS